MRLLWENLDEGQDISKGRSADRAWLGVKARIEAKNRRTAPPRPPVRRRARANKKNAFTRAVVVMLVILIPVTVVYLQQRVGENAEPEWVTYASGIGERVGIRLNDGSMAYLSVNSELRVPEVFRADIREVELIGEGYFEITSDATRPFVVHTGEASIEVLGTEFNLRAYRDEEDVHLVVTEGRVGMYARGESLGDGADISAGQQSVFKPDRSIDVSEATNVDRVLGWRNGSLAFFETPFEDVTAELERWYEARFEFDDSTLRQVDITATFELSDDEPLGSVLTVLTESVGIAYERHGNDVVFLRK